MSRLKGYIFNNAGTPVEGATVTALEAGTTTAIGSTVESGSDGSWSFLWDRPLTLIIMLIISLIIGWQIYKGFIHKKM